MKWNIFQQFKDWRVFNQAKTVKVEFTVVVSHLRREKILLTKRFIYCLISCYFKDDNYMLERLQFIICFNNFIEYLLLFWERWRSQFFFWVIELEQLETNISNYILSYLKSEHTTKSFYYLKKKRVKKETKIQISTTKKNSGRSDIF